jgi:hypothetical protein
MAYYLYIAYINPVIFITPERNPAFISIYPLFPNDTLQILHLQLWTITFSLCRFADYS